MWLEQIVQANSNLESRDSVSIVSSLEEMPTIISHVLQNYIFFCSTTSIINHAVRCKCITKSIFIIKYVICK